MGERRGGSFDGRDRPSPPGGGERIKYVLQNDEPQRGRLRYIQSFRSEVSSLGSTGTGQSEEDSSTRYTVMFDLNIRLCMVEDLR